MIHSYRGGCQCGAVLYEVELDLAAPAKGAKSVWQRVVRPNGFRLLEGEEQLSGVQFWDGAMHNFYCSECGAHAYSRHTVASHGTFYIVDVLALHAKKRVRPAPALIMR
ncbi:MAG: hypothetical protein ABW252_11400 [Polyangiales bacterium]